MKYLNLLIRLFLLKRNMSGSRKQLEGIQEKKLRKILNHAYHHSPYYKRTFEEKGITADQIGSRPLSDFPVIDKESLMENFDELITVPGLKQQDLLRFDEDSANRDSLFLDKFHVVHSSGSTGVPRYFIYDEDAWSQMLLGIIRGALWDLSVPQILKLLAGGIRILYVAAVNGRYGGAMAVGGGVDGLKGSRLFIDVNTPLSEWGDKIDNFKPNIIIGYPSALKILAEITERGDVEINASRVISCGEPLSHGMRLFYEKVFCKSVVNIYGASESLALGVETDAEEGMYLFDDLNYIEILEDRIYLTSLYNFAQPLIRYRISDKLVPLREHKPDGLPFSRVNVLLSREEDILWFEDSRGRKDFIHPLAIEGFCLEGLIDFQFARTGDRSFEMRMQVPDVVKRPAVEEEMRRKMGAILTEKKMDYVEFSIRFVDEIFPDPKTGKKRLILEAEKYRSVV